VRREEIEEVAARDRGRALDLAVRETPGYAGVVARLPYTEDRLAAAVERGVRQYVLVGAGMDTFAFRRPDLSAKLEIFEVDHAATQAMKRERLARAGLAQPAHLHFVATDFENESLADALSRSPYRAGSAAFFAWLGVTPYLSRDANLATLRSMGEVASARSEVVFDYIEAAALEARRASEEAKRMVAERKGTDEPYVCGFEPDRVGEDLRAVGLERIEDLGPRELARRYGGGLHFVAPGHLVWARTAR
jgi:methyltransferase (TIGR00027 family)